MNSSTHKKKLIEVALPLEAINKAGAREKSIRHGHPSTLHLWWSRKPHAVARAVLFAQLVDDPSEYTDVLLSDPAKRSAAKRVLRKRQRRRGGVNPEPGSESSAYTLEEVAAELERERLFDLMRELVKWENTNNARLLEQARDEIRLSWRRTCVENVDHPQADELFNPNKLPGFHDPFAGGGALPLEAQRLGLEAYASDLNPVAVLINKAMIEIPPKFAGQPPVNPEARRKSELIERTWTGAHGLAEDIRYYGQWMRDEAEKKIGHLYPKVEVTSEMVRKRPDLKPYEGEKLTVIAWLWARTVKSPNPAFSDVDVPLAYTWMLSSKKGKEAYVEPVIEGKSYHFTVKIGPPPDSERTKRGTKSGGSASSFVCLMSDVAMSFSCLRKEAKAKGMGQRLMAIVAEGIRGRVYLDPLELHEQAACTAGPRWSPDNALPEKALGFRVQEYGMTRWKDLFTSRQLLALSTFSDLVRDAISCVQTDAALTGLVGKEYAQAIGVYLAFCP